MKKTLFCLVLAITILSPWFFWFRPVFVIDVVLLLVVSFLGLLSLDLLVGAQMQKPIEQSFQAQNGRLYFLVASMSVSLFMGMNCLLDRSETERVVRQIAAETAASLVLPLVEVPAMGRSLFPIAKSETIGVVVGISKNLPREIVLQFKPGFLGLPYFLRSANGQKL